MFYWTKKKISEEIEKKIMKGYINFKYLNRYFIKKKNYYIMHHITR